MTTRSLLLLLLLALALPAPATLAAQQRAQRFDGAAASPPALPVLPELPGLRVAKWSTLALSLATAGYGVAAHTRADRRFERLEATCRQDPDRCGERLQSGAYADAELEARYQQIVRLDRRARASLIVSQLGVVATVAMFLLDMRDDRDPETIPYDPEGLRIDARRDGLALGWAVAVGR